MNATIANVILDRIEAANIPWIDKTAGLTRAITFTKTSKTPGTWPIACTVNDPLACDDSTIGELLPQEQYNSVLFFEGDAFPSREKDRKGPNLTVFTSKLRLVVWLNCSRLGGECNCGDLASLNLISAIEGTKYNSGPLLDIRHTVVGGGPARGRDIFSRYTFNEARSQYLHFPFDFFALDIETTFRVMKGCEDQVEPGNVNCWTGPDNVRRKYPDQFSCEELQGAHGLTAEQLGPDCLDCSGTGTCPTECEVLADITDPLTAATCVTDEMAIAMGGSFIDRAAYTVDLLNEQIRNAGKDTALCALLCTPCTVSGIIQLDGVQVGTYGPFDPCEDNTLTIVLQ